MATPIARQFKDRDEWLAARKATLGGSDIPAALFAEGNRTPLVVQYEKLGEIPPLPMSPRFKMGLAAEPVLAEQAEERLGFPVVEPSRTGPVIYYNPDCPAIHATPDRFVLDRRPERVHPQTLPSKSKLVLSLKSWTVNGRDMWTDRPPLYAIIQLQSEMLVTGIHTGAIAVGFGLCEDFSLYPEIEFHEKLGERIKNEAPAWWNRHIVHREPVPAMAPDTKLLSEIYPTAVPGSFLILSSPEWRAVYDEWQKAAENAKLWTEVADSKKAKILQEMGDAEIAVFSETESVSWKTQVRNDPPREAKTYTLRVARRVKTPKELIHEIQAGDTALSAPENDEPGDDQPGALGYDGPGEGVLSAETPGAGEQQED